jgi:hypothetical protein
LKYNLRMDFFVYLHRRASNGKVFYVGKGTRRRHKSKWNRSQHWHNIVNKHGYTIEIVQNGMQEWWAFELERELILKYQSDGLCNRTEGGEGSSGFRLSTEKKALLKVLRRDEKWRQNISQKAKARFRNEQYMLAHIARLKKINANPELKNKRRQATLAQFSAPEARDRARQTTIKQFSDPRARDIARINALARYDTPDKRASHVQAKALRCVTNGMIFGTTTLAAEWVASWRNGKSDNSQIAKACRGVIPEAYGLKWEYLTPTKEVLVE